jgi:hypothetical protein
LTSRDIDTLLPKIVCDVSNPDCMNRVCDLCKGRRAYDAEKVIVNVLQFWQWESQTNDGYVSTKCVHVSEWESDSHKQN